MNAPQNCFTTTYDSPYEVLRINYGKQLENYYLGKSLKTPSQCIQEYKDAIKRVATPVPPYKYVNDAQIDSSIKNYTQCIINYYDPPITKQVLYASLPQQSIPLWLWLIIILSGIFLFLIIFELSKSPIRRVSNTTPVTPVKSVAPPETGRGDSIVTYERNTPLTIRRHDVRNNGDCFYESVYNYLKGEELLNTLEGRGLDISNITSFTKSMKKLAASRINIKAIFDTMIDHLDEKNRIINDELITREKSIEDFNYFMRNIRNENCKQSIKMFLEDNYIAQKGGLYIKSDYSDLLDYFQTNGCEDGYIYSSFLELLNKIEVDCCFIFDAYANGIGGSIAKVMFAFENNPTTYQQFEKDFKDAVKVKYNFASEVEIKEYESIFQELGIVIFIGQTPKAVEDKIRADYNNGTLQKNTIYLIRQGQHYNYLTWKN